MLNLETNFLESNYLAEVFAIEKIEKHPNADKLQIVTHKHRKIIVGLDYNIGDVCVYFPIECQIHSSICHWLNLYQESLLNSDPSKKGFFNNKNRVRAVSLRGTLSEGFILKLDPVIKVFEKISGFDPIQIDPLDFIGKDFDTFRFGETSMLVCEKYEPRSKKKGPANMPKLDRKVRHNRIVDGQFHFHVKTEQLKKNIDRIYPSDTITISEKLHGTSVVISNILTKRKLSWIERIVNKFIPVKDTRYDLVYSSRNVIKNQYDYGNQPNHFYKEDIWGVVAKEVYSQLDPGITIYGEIVGYLKTGSYIQKGYDYGCEPGEHKLFVYRITYTDAIGNVLEFTTNQMVNYCNRKGLMTVPLHYYGPVNSYAPDHDSLLSNLQSLVRERCYICNNKVPAEGIVVTVESNTFQGYKLKSDAFYEFESKMLDEEYVDIEETN